MSGQPLVIPTDLLRALLQDYTDCLLQDPDFTPALDALYDAAREAHGSALLPLADAFRTSWKLPYYYRAILIRALTHKQGDPQRSWRDALMQAMDDFCELYRRDWLTRLYHGRYDATPAELQHFIEEGSLLIAETVPLYDPQTETVEQWLRRVLPRIEQALRRLAQPISDALRELGQLPRNDRRLRALYDPEYRERVCRIVYLRVIQQYNDVQIQAYLQQHDRCWLETESIRKAGRDLMRLMQFPPEAFLRKRGRPKRA